MTSAAAGGTPATPQRAEAPYLHRRRRGRPTAPPVSPVDWLMLLLAVVSVGLLTWITFWDVAEPWHSRVIVADYLICGVFALEFLWRWQRSGLGWGFPARYWYEVIGMIPLSDPAFRAFRLLRIVAVAARLARAADRAFGDRATAYVVNRFTDTVVEVIRRPVTIAVLDEVIPVIAAGDYARHLAAAIDENRAELDALVVDLIRQDRAAGSLRFLPFHDEVVRLVTDTVFRISKGALDDPRVHELISDVIREAAVQLRESIRSKELAAVRAELEADLVERAAARGI